MTKSSSGGAVLVILLIGAAGAGFWLWSSLTPRAAALICVSDALGDGETRTYTIDGVDYETTAVNVTATQAAFSVNGDLTPALGQGEAYTLPGNLTIQVIKIFQATNDAVVRFAFLEPGCIPPDLLPTAEQRCGLCVGDTFENVSAVGMPDDQTCQALGTELNQDLYAWSEHTECINNEPIETPRFFRPQVGRIWIKDLTKSYVSNRRPGRDEYTRCHNNGAYQADECWVELRAPHLGQVPQELVTTEWAPGRTIDVLVEVDNTAADVYDEARLTDQERRDLAALAANITEFDWAHGNWWGRYRYWFDRFAISAFDATGPIDSDAQNRELAGYRKQFVAAAPYLSVGILEVGFYGHDAAAAAYSQDYGRQASFYDVRLKTDTVKRANACQGDEDWEGWLRHFAVLLTPPIKHTDGLTYFWQYNATQRFHTFNGRQLGGAAKVQLMTRIKLPDPDDRLANGQSNFDAEGRYYLHTAVFDRCDRPDRPPLTLRVRGLSLTLPNPVPTPQVCCEVGSLWWPWTPPQYYRASLAYCQDLNRTGPANLSWQKGAGIAVARPLDDCPAKVTQGEACYRCAPTLGGLITHRTKKTGDCARLNRNAQGDPQDLGYTTDHAAAQRECCSFLPPDQRLQRPTMCMTCAGDKIETCGTCPQGTVPMNTSIINVVCPDLQLTTCYACGPNGANHVIMTETNQPELFEYHAHPQTACQAVTTERGQPLWGGRNAWTHEEIVGGACQDNPKEAVVAFINPANDTQFCLRRTGLTDEQNCRRERFPRKPGIRLSDLDRLDPITGSELASQAWMADQHNPLCLNRLGPAQCLNTSECLAALNSDLPENRDHKRVYDALVPVLSRWWERLPSWFIDLFTTESPVEDKTEEWGICTPRTRGFLGWFLSLPWWQKTLLAVFVLVVLTLLYFAFTPGSRTGRTRR